MNLRKLLTELRNRGKGLVDFARGSNIATFSVFLLISAAFWLLMKINDEQQLDLNLQVEITDMPDNITLLTSELPIINVSLRDKGSSLLRYSWGETPTLSFKFKELPAVSNRLLVGSLQTNNAIRKLFNQATISRVKPDSIIIPFTSRPGKLMHVRITEGDMSVNDKYTLSGNMELLTDTVRLYSAAPIPRSMMTLHTLPVNISELTDTTVITARLDIPKGMRAIPDAVKIRVPVEPLIAAERTIDIKVEGSPANQSVIPFTGKAKVSYLVPLSKYNNESQIITVYADYRRRNSRTSKMPVSAIVPKSGYRNLSVTPDSVEYLVETE